MTISTNDPDRLASECREIFSALGFFPKLDVDETVSATADPIIASFFGDLLFLYGGTLPVVVMTSEATSGHYEYLAYAPVTVGEVVQGFLGDRPVYWFKEDPDVVSQRARIPIPEAARLVLWDSSGRLAYRVGYSALEWDGETLEITGNMGVFQSTCALGSSAVMCWGRSAICQLSLLDPVSWEPTVLQSKISVKYVHDNLRINFVRLSTVPGARMRSVYLACEIFQTINDIIAFSQFGTCGSNLQGVAEWRCLGSAEAYMRESREASQTYWLELRRRLYKTEGSLPITVDPRLMTALESLDPVSGNSSQSGASAPVGLGRLDALLMINAVIPED